MKALVPIRPIGTRQHPLPTCQVHHTPCLLLTAWAVGAALSFLPLHVAGQDSLLLRDYDFVKTTDAWLSSRNGATLTRFDTSNLSVAEVTVTRERGGFVDYSSSPDVWQASASVSSRGISTSGVMVRVSP